MYRFLGRRHDINLQRDSLRIRLHENNTVDISWVSHGPGEADTGSNNGTARLVTIPSLRLGARYTATIMDLAAEDNLVSFAFSACKCKFRTASGSAERR